MTKQTQKKRRGFAVMDPQRVREIASMGGQQAHRDGTAHQFTPEEAAAAGRRSHMARKTRAGQQ